MAGPTKGVTRINRAKLLQNDKPDVEVALALAEMLRDVAKEATDKGTPVKWSSLRVTADPATQDPSFHQLRVGIHVG